MAKRPKPEYVARNKEYLQTIAAQADTKVLPRGVLYKVIESGAGESPEANSIVSVHYSGELISGHCFDSSRVNNYPETFRLREVIVGWQIALRAMRVGDRWRVYIPSAEAYGDRTMDDIPGGSTLIFDIELIAIS
ncbi:MAG: FKBP-type peptidyl-prolyl cis-trans isomerase [Rikenellaceae bacterium]